MTEILLVPDDTRKAAVLAALLKKENEVTRKLCAITFARRQMDIHCPLGILSTLRRNGQANYFELQLELENRFKGQFSRDHFQQAWSDIEKLLNKLLGFDPLPVRATA